MTLDPLFVLVCAVKFFETKFCCCCLDSTSRTNLIISFFSFFKLGLFFFFPFFFNKNIIAGTGTTVMGGNEYYTLNGTVNECGVELSAWQKEGHDKDSTAGTIPKDEIIIQWASTLLGMNEK